MFLCGCSARVEHIVATSLNNSLGFKNSKFHRPNEPVCVKTDKKQGIVVFATHRKSQYPSIFIKGLKVNIDEKQFLAPWKKLERIESFPGEKEIKLSYNTGFGIKESVINFKVEEGKWGFINYHMPAFAFNKPLITYGLINDCSKS